jgi:hypothetical protein
LDSLETLNLTCNATGAERAPGGYTFGFSIWTSTNIRTMIFQFTFFNN